LTIAGAVMARPYMPPEQARGETVDQRADVFALGAMLYHLLAGVPPYNARTATDVLRRRRARPGGAAASSASGRSPKELVRDRRAPRWPLPRPTATRTPARLADELRRFLTGQLVGAHSYTALERVTRFVPPPPRGGLDLGARGDRLRGRGTIAVHRIVEARDEARTEASIAQVANERPSG